MKSSLSPAWLLATSAAAPASADVMKLLFLCLGGVPRGEVLVEAEMMACFDPRCVVVEEDVLARRAWYKGEAEREPAVKCRER